jgi:hypothetical protein
MNDIIDPQLVWLFAEKAAQAVLGHGDDDTPVSELRHTATEAGLAAVLPVIEARIRAQIAAEGAQLCAFHARNPFTGTLGQCIDPAETAVVVAITTPHGAFKGDGVRVEVCKHHAGELRATYGAVAVPTADQGVTVLPGDAFDALAASLDDPPVPNEATRDAFRRLSETIERRPDTTDDAQ